MVTLTRSLRAGARALLSAGIVAGGLAGAPTISAQQSPDMRDEVDADRDAAQRIACPVPGGSEFIDGYGAPRSGGRRHQGVDMIARRGAPVVAAQTGYVNFKQNRLGGNAAWLTTADGNEFYYAHFDAFEGASRFVLIGDLIGYVGSTGNAQGPHLHFETHFDGNVTNPYPATYAACVQPEIDTIADQNVPARTVAARGALAPQRSRSSGVTGLFR